MSKHHTATEIPRRAAAPPPRPRSPEGTRPRQLAHPISAGGRTRRHIGRWIGGAVLVLVIVAVAFFSLPGSGLAQSGLSAGNTRHDFGTVRMSGGIISTQFPLTVQGSVQVVGLDTT